MSLGTSNFGILDVPMPDKSVFVSQILYGSIGWATGKYCKISSANLYLTEVTSASTLGVALAARDKCLGRTILFTGDGSMCVVHLSSLKLAYIFHMAGN
jgi:pyruvate decarboxylase